jgi:hypothetical protein
LQNPIVSFRLRFPGFLPVLRPGLEDEAIVGEHLQKRAAHSFLQRFLGEGRLRRRERFGIAGSRGIPRREADRGEEEKNQRSGVGRKFHFRRQKPYLAASQS